MVQFKRCETIYILLSIFMLVLDLLEHELKICETTMLVTDHRTFFKMQSVIPRIASLKVGFRQQKNVA